MANPDPRRPFPMRICLVALCLLFAGSAKSRGRESLLTEITQGRSAGIHNAVFRADTTRRYEVKECKGHAVTISAWVWLTTSQSSFFAANDAFFHGLVFGLERSKASAEQRLMTCLGTGKAWEKTGGVVDCPSGCWNHLVATIEPTGRVTEYLNGHPVVSTSTGKQIEIVPGSILSVMFGSEASTAGMPADTELGRLGGFEIYDSAMRPDEVKALYLAGQKDANPTVKPSWFLVWSWVMMIGAGAFAITLSMRSWNKKLHEIPAPVSLHRRLDRRPY
jgi:hypothetical protein